MSVRKRLVNDKFPNKELTVKEIFSKAIKAESDWPDKDEFLDVVYWMRQILGIILGIVWGILPMSGIVGLLSFLAINTAAVYVYYNTYQKVDEEEFGGLSEILKEGLMTSFATFLVCWIILYSALYF